MDDLIPKNPDIEKELVIKSCKTCYFPGKSPVGCPAQECHDCCQLSNWQEKEVEFDPLIIAFVQGAQWWEFHKTNATMWPSDRHLAEDEAKNRVANCSLGVPIENRLSSIMSNVADALDSSNPLSHTGSGNPNQGGATEENNILGGLLKDRGSEMAPELLEFARELQNEAKLHNIKVEQIVKRLEKYMEKKK